MSLIEQLHLESIAAVIWLIKKRDFFIRVSKSNENCLIELITPEDRKIDLSSHEKILLSQANFLNGDSGYHKKHTFTSTSYYAILGILGFLIIAVFGLMGEFEIVVKK